MTGQCTAGSSDVTKQCGYIYPGAVGPTCGADGVCQCGPGTACGCLFAPSSVCPVKNLDFDNAVKGEYIRDKWAQSHGIRITAVKDSDCAVGVGYTPWGAARIFDTADPGTNNDNGDPDLGSPNEDCDIPGPGVGAAGSPDNGSNPAVWNCVPQHKTLIIQESHKIYPDDIGCGGTITFDFYHTPAFLSELGFLDVDDNESVEVTVRLNTQ
jgi:hypothetical protein